MIDERRKSILTEIDLEAITSAIRGGMTNEEHQQEHEVLRRWIQRDVERTEFRNKLKQQVAGWGAITILGGIGLGAWQAIVYIKDHIR